MVRVPVTLSRPLFQVKQIVELWEGDIARELLLLPSNKPDTWQYLIPRKALAGRRTRPPQSE